MKVRMRATGDWSGLKDQLRAYVNTGGDLRPLWEQIADDLYDRMAGVFAGGGGPGWDPLAPAYRAWKSTFAPGAPVGVLSGGLRASLTGPDHRWSRHHLLRDQATLGTKAPHAHLLTDGAARTGRGGLQPPRRIEIASDDAIARWAEMAAEHLAGQQPTGVGL